MDDLKSKLASQEVELAQKNEAANKLIQVVGAETEKVPHYPNTFKNHSIHPKALFTRLSGFQLGLENIENSESVFQSGKVREQTGKVGKSHKILEKSGNFKQSLGSTDNQSCQRIDDVLILHQVSKEKAVADEEEKKVQVITEEVGKKQQDCEKDLAKAEPALRAAQEALNTLNKVQCSQ